MFLSMCLSMYKSVKVCVSVGVSVFKRVCKCV